MSYDSTGPVWVLAWSWSALIRPRRSLSTRTKALTHKTEIKCPTCISARSSLTSRTQFLGCRCTLSQRFALVSMLFAGAGPRPRASSSPARRAATRQLEIGLEPALVADLSPRAEHHHRRRWIDWKHGWSGMNSCPDDSDPRSLIHLARCSSSAAACFMAAISRLRCSGCDGGARSRSPRSSEPEDPAAGASGDWFHHQLTGKAGQPVESRLTRVAKAMKSAAPNLRIGGSWPRRGGWTSAPSIPQTPRSRTSGSATR